MASAVSVDGLLRDIEESAMACEATDRSTPMKDELSCDFHEAELNQLDDALAMTPAQRWNWLREAMDSGFQLARARAEQGLVTLGAHGEVLWSPELEREWTAEGRPRA